MNIETTGINKSSKVSQTQTKTQVENDSQIKFSDELKELEKENKSEEKVVAEQNLDLEVQVVPEEGLDLEEKVDAEDSKEDRDKVEKNSEKVVSKASSKLENKNDNLQQQNTAIDNDILVVYKDLNKVVQEINRLDDKDKEPIKKDDILADNESMINNDFNIENKEILPQMNPGMNFNSNGQPFSSFMNEEAQNGSSKVLGANAADLAEEAAVLSTMAENIAIANKNTMLKQSNKVLASNEEVKQEEKIVVNNEGIKKVDTKTGITTENIVKFDAVIMNEADVEVFTQLVQNGAVDMKNLAPQAAEKSVQVSKTLADMLAKAMETSQPVRIDFDNNISVIIRISRDGKITADFLPSSQVAEAYLKENLPLLRQKFDSENIKYDELNQRERREHTKDQNRKKGRNDE